MKPILLGDAEYSIFCWFLSYPPPPLRQGDIQLHQGYPQDWVPVQLWLKEEFVPSQSFPELLPQLNAEFPRGQTAEELVALLVGGPAFMKPAFDL